MTKIIRKIYAVIPARGGSKTIPKKNIRPLKGFPLIAYSIAAAKLSKKIDRVIVTTDSEEIASIAKKFGAETPFLRPAEIAQDHSTDREFMDHLITWLLETENEVPAMFVHLRPTSPLRNPEVIDSAIETMLENSSATSLRSGNRHDFVPEKAFRLNGGFFEGLFPEDQRPEYHNLPRQIFPPVYKPNGYVDILKTEFILNNPPLLHGDKILGFLTPDTDDIDNQSDLKNVERLIEERKMAILSYLENLASKKSKGKK